MVLETSEKEAVDAAGVLVTADDLLRGIDAACKGALGSRIGEIEVGRGDATIRVVQEAVVAASVNVKPGDLPCIVDAECSRVGGGEGIVESRVAPVVIEEAVPAAGVAVKPDDLTQIVDAQCKGAAGGRGRGIIEGGVGPVAIEEAVGVVAGVGVLPDDLARRVDAKRLGVVVGRGIIEGGVGVDRHGPLHGANSQ